MSWLYESFERESALNGRIRCTRVLGSRTVMVGGTGQASPYLDAMWKRAVRAVTDEPDRIRRILILGMATGAGFRLFYRRFRRAHITTIEADPVMIGLAKEFGTFKHLPAPDIHLGRAEQILPRLHGPFDLIVSDMFLGHDVAPETSGEIVKTEISRLLDPNGYLLVNAYSQPDVLDAFGRTFVQTRRLKHEFNWLGVFRPHGAGVVGDRLPDGYVPYISSRAYLEREYANRKNLSVATSGGVWGVRSQIGPFILERFVNTEEPTKGMNGKRFVLWDPVTRTDRPAGWHRIPRLGWRRLTGYVDLLASTDLHHGWNENVKREWKKWQAQDEFVIRSASLDAYLAAYAKCGKGSSLVSIFSDAIRHKARANGDRLHLRVVVRQATGDILAGWCSLDVPEIELSIHVSSFILPASRRGFASVALVEDWFSSARARGIRYADFDGFFAPGDPVSWKGFSRFKSQFGTRYIRYPDPLWRFF